MKFIIDSKITLTGATKPLFLELAEYFTIENPKYTEAERMERSTYDLDPYLRYYRQEGGVIVLPRGAARHINDAAARYGNVEIIDNRLALQNVDLCFTGNLRAYQQQAVNGVLAKDFGVLEAGTGSGKTVMALAIIAARKQPTLVLVHTKELLYQWRDRIQQFLGIEAGLIGDGKYDVRPVTVGIVNSVKKALPSLVKRFGHLVVDECHRVPSSLFSEVVTAFPVKYCLGLSATPLRRDGLTVLIGWFIGLHKQTLEMRTLHQVGAVLRPKIITKVTEFRWQYEDDYQEMISALVKDTARNSLIATDIREQANRGGISLVVSDRTAHLQTLAEMAQIDHAILTGKTPAKKRRDIVERVAGGDMPALFSTLSLIGEGFDAPGLSTLFLASPIKFRGRLIQTVGRVLRPAEGKEPLVFDYNDVNVGILQHQWKSRQQVFAGM